MNYSLLLLLVFCFFNASLSAQSRKELLAQCQQWQLKQSQWQRDSLRQSSEIRLLNEEIATLTGQVEMSQSNQRDLEESLSDCRTLLRKNVEVYDLYSFGYQPLRNSTKEYEEQLRTAQRAIEAARWKNVEQLVAQLNHKKTAEDRKELLFKQFLRIYPSLNIANRLDLAAFAPELQQQIKTQITQQTQTELRNTTRENLWIQALEEGWDSANNGLLGKY